MIEDAELPIQYDIIDLLTLTPIGLPLGDAFAFSPHILVRGRVVNLAIGETVA